MRAAKLGRNFGVSLQRAGIVVGTPAAEALKATMIAIRSAEKLPTAVDSLVTVPPVGVSYVRRVRRLNLWLHFRENPDSSILFMVIVRQPPVPLDDPDGEDPDLA